MYHTTSSHVSHYKFPRITLQDPMYHTTSSHVSHCKFPCITLQVPMYHTTSSHVSHYKFPCIPQESPTSLSREYPHCTLVYTCSPTNYIHYTDQSMHQHEPVSQNTRFYPGSHRYRVPPDHCHVPVGPSPYCRVQAVGQAQPIAHDKMTT
ncbi:hypothetical protein BgiMline_002933 [Biomphalaria glabrata]